MSKDDFVNRYTGQIKRTVDTGVSRSFNPGPFVAIVRNHLDSHYMGGLEVELLTKTGSGNAPKEPGLIFPVSYLSPFYSATPFDGTQPNTEHQFSQKSAGMWFVPPDIGTKVLVIFAEAGQGFWLGCIPETYTNFMLPASDVSTTYNSVDNSKKLPVGEYNKQRLEVIQGNDATQYTKPINQDQLSVLQQQGLENDETRGITSSSARRELPSSVFGISTPGPYDRRPDAPKTNYGPLDKAQIFHNRLGGSSIVFDDGDATLLRKGSASENPSEYANSDAGETDGDVTIPHNEMLRIKTRTGHQIILHNSEDLVYVTNSKGTTWIELTSNGKIDIFAEDSVSVHSKNDINFKADRDINFEAGRDFNVKANNNIAEEAVNNRQVIVGENNQITIGGFSHTSTEKEINFASNSSDFNVVTQQNINLQSDNTTNLLSTKNINLQSESESINIKSEKHNNITTVSGDISVKSGNYYFASTTETYHINDPNAVARESSAASSAQLATPAESLTTWELPGEEEKVILRRVPQHEPWLQHENLNPAYYTPEETDIKKLNDAGDGIDLTPPQTAEYTMTPDTFRKGN
jgi:hypothetical protein